MTNERVSIGAVGKPALVVASSGFYSKRFIGQKGVAVLKLTASTRVRWVLKFSSSLLGDEEGLFDDCELQWCGS